jgi:choice-of-anchor A domain-containing protein
MQRTQQRIAFRAAAALAGSGLLVAFMLSGNPAAAQALAPVTIGNPVAGSNGFGVVTEGDATFGSTESEGPVAVGGNLSFGDNYNVALNTPGSFVAPGDDRPTSLLVGGGIDYGATSPNGVLQVLNNSYAKFGDVSASDVLTTDQNGANVNTEVVKKGSAYNSQPRVQLTAQQSAASVHQSGLMDFTSLFSDYRDRADTMAGCASTVQLLDDAGAPLPTAIPAGTNAFVALTPGKTNVLRLTGEQLNNLSELTFLDQPSADTPLLITVDTTGTGGSFTWHTPTMAGVSGTQAPYILWNFADATDITIADGDTVEGTLYAPRAKLTDLDASNIEGDIITRELVAGPLSGGAGGGAVNAGEIHYFPFDADLQCDGTPTPNGQGAVSVRKVDAESGDTLAGAEFQLWRESNGEAGLQTSGADPDTQVDTCTTTARGICSDVVDPGTYYWRETKAPAGYETPSPGVYGPLVLTADNLERGATVTVPNTKRADQHEGRVSVDKVDSATGKPLSGAEFQLWRESNGEAGLQTSGADPDTRVGDPCTTGAAGRCSDTVAVGTYYWQETKAPEGYELPSPAVFGPAVLTEANAAAGVTVTARNTQEPTPPEGSLHLKKTDAKTGRALEGAVFQLWKESNGTAGLQTNGARPDTLTDRGCATDAQGSCDFDPLADGTYYLRETAVPEGYVLPANPVTGPYVIDGTHESVTVTVKNERGEPCKGGGKC